MTEKFPETEGELQRKVEAAMEHANHAWGKMVQMGTAHEGRRWPPDPDDERTSTALTAAYHVAVMIGYLFRVQQGMSKMWGTTDGQLCPYEGCGHNLAFPEEGWYMCGHCKRPLYARACDGDFEDYHCEIPEEGALMPTARDLGPSWGMPKEVAT